MELPTREPHQQKDEATKQEKAGSGTTPQTASALPAFTIIDEAVAYRERNLSRANSNAPAKSATALVADAGSISGAAGIALATPHKPDSISINPATRVANRTTIRVTLVSPTKLKDRLIKTIKPH
jgi:hypothetical protein